MTVSEQIIQVIDALCEKFGIVVDWTSQNIIPSIESLCEKLITYEICTSIVWMAIMILSSIGSIIATKKLAPIFKKGIDSRSSIYDDEWVVASIVAIIGLVVLNLASIIVICVQVMDIVKCTTFPEMYIFEYISTLIQQ